MIKKILFSAFFTISLLFVAGLAVAASTNPYGNLKGATVDIGATTAAPATGAPAAPTGLIAIPSRTSNTEMVLSWKAIANSSATYNIYYSTSQNGTFQLINIPNRSLTSYTQVGLDPGTTYYYQVKSFLNSIESAPATANATTSGTAAPSTAAPAAGAKPGATTGAQLGIIGDADACSYITSGDTYVATKSTVIKWMSKPYSTLKVGMTLDPIAFAQGDVAQKTMADCTKLTSTQPSTGGTGTIGATDTCYAGSNNSEGVYVTVGTNGKVTWTGSSLFSVGDIYDTTIAGLGLVGKTFSQTAITDCTNAAPAAETQADIIKFVFTAANGKNVNNVAIAKFTTADDKEAPDTKALSNSTNIVDYARPKNKEEVTIRGFKDFKDSKNAKGEFTRIFAKCGESDLLKINANTASTVKCEFKNLPAGMENDMSATYTETDGSDFVIYTPTDMPVGKSSIYFRAVRYSYAGAGFTEFPQFAPVGGANFNITLVSASKVVPKTGLLGTEKALAQTAPVVDNWTGYKCFSILGGLPVARISQPANSVPKENDCFATAGDPKTAPTCTPTKFARQTTGSSPEKYVYLDKPSGTRYPVTADNQGVANPTPPTCTPKDDGGTSKPADNAGEVGAVVPGQNSATGAKPGTAAPANDLSNLTTVCIQLKTDSKYYTATKNDNAGMVSYFFYTSSSDHTGKTVLSGDASEVDSSKCPSGVTAAPTQIAGGGQLPTAIAPWDQNRVKPYTRSTWQGWVDGLKNTLGISSQNTISGTIPDNGIQSGVMLAKLPAGVYTISISKAGYSTSKFMFELKDNEQLDLKGLSIAPGATVKEAPSINADIMSGQYGAGISAFVADQFQLSKDRINTLLFAKRGTTEKGFVYYPSYPTVGWLPAGMDPPGKTTYSEEVPGVPILTGSSGASTGASGNAPWTGVPAGTAGRAVSDCAAIFKAQGMDDGYAIAAAVGLIGHAAFKDPTWKDASLSIAMLALASGSTSKDGVCGGSGYGNNYGYATAPQCCQAGQDCDASPLPSCISRHPIIETILNFSSGLFNSSK